MSRIGKNLIQVPEKVTLALNGSDLEVKGPGGNLKITLASCISVDISGNVVSVKCSSPEDRFSRAIWGTSRSLINNMVVGVSKGFVRLLEFNGVGYKASVSGKKLTLGLGYSHPIDYEVPEGIVVKVNKNIIEVHGIDKEKVGFVASQIRAFRAPEPYKGKGIKYLDEKIIRKAGKSGGKK